MSFARQLRATRIPLSILAPLLLQREATVSAWMSGARVPRPAVQAAVIDLLRLVQVHNKCP